MNRIKLPKSFKADSRHDYDQILCHRRKRDRRKKKKVSGGFPLPVAVSLCFRMKRCHQNFIYIEFAQVYLINQ